MLASIMSSASASRPTSVFPAAWSMRRERSPPAIAAAVDSIPRSGARLARTSGRPTPIIVESLDGLLSLVQAGVLKAKPL